MGGSSYGNPETQLSGHGHLTGAGTSEVTLLGNKTLNLTLLPLHLSPAPLPQTLAEFIQKPEGRAAWGCGPGHRA